MHGARKKNLLRKKKEKRNPERGLRGTVGAKFAYSIFKKMFWTKTWQLVANYVDDYKQTFLSRVGIVPHSHSHKKELPFIGVGGEVLYIDEWTQSPNRV